MIFRNPWAWLGVIAIAGPILAHLLAGRSARRQLFPTLRFFPAGIQRPVSPSRLTDLGLLILRIAIVALAVFALAQPVWLSPARVQQLGQRLARAIVVDTSASMSRTQTAGGRPVLEDARSEATRTSAEATTSRVVEADALSIMIDSGLTWLSKQPMRRELVFISDFQAGTLTRADIDRIPGNIGIRLIQIAPAGQLALPPDRMRESVTLLAGSADRAGAQAARQAALSQGAPDQAPASRPVAVLFPSYETRSTLLKDARGLDQPWMFDVVDRMSRDSLLRDASVRLEKPVSEMVSVVICRIEGIDTLVLVTGEAPASVAAAALFAAAARAAADVPPATEQSSEFLSAEDMRSWNRPPGDNAPAGDAFGGVQGSPPIKKEAQESHGRWIWMVVLALIGIEMFVRRTHRRDTSTDEDAIAA